MRWLVCLFIFLAAVGAEHVNTLCPTLNAEEYHNGKIADFAQVGMKAPDDHTLQITLRDPALRCRARES